ncbi:SIR2 family protein [Flavobacterium sp. 245]|uniref:SIR2 family protein n=1 Tax=Flavobacterium sp. 245 TaxID=2512115 RepID=UPI00105C9531|nr:SIR2 family protein [Flavobacterium sp. 245]TDO96071.1 SIR2-like protein [Flavobacterium sp. 245]
MTNHKEISLLIGAGFSVEAGIPVRNQINDRLKSLTWDQFIIHSETTTHFLRGHDPNSHWQNVHERKFVQAVIKFYNQSVSDKFDYEEFYDYCFKISHHAKDLDFDGFFKNYVKKTNFPIDRQNALSIVIRTIDYLVNDLLTVDNTGIIDKYQSFMNLLNRLKEKFEVIHIFSLNHDLLIENMFESSISFEYSDGFEIGGSRYYIKQKNRQIRIKYFNDRFDKQVRLYKLHGSIDHYIYNFSDPYQMIKIPKDLYPLNLYKETKIGEHWVEENCWTLYEPIFLSGTTTKILNYDKNPLHSSQFIHFKEALKKSKLLIAIGYGLQDEKINEFVRQELNNGLQMLIVKRSKDPNEFFALKNVKHYGDGLGVSDLNFKNIESLITAIYTD